MGLWLKNGPSTLQNARVKNHHSTGWGTENSDCQASCSRYENDKINECFSHIGRNPQKTNPQILVSRFTRRGCFSWLVSCCTTLSRRRSRWQRGRWPGWPAGILPNLQGGCRGSPGTLCWCLRMLSRSLVKRRFLGRSHCRRSVGCTWNWCQPARTLQRTR